jgi:hypothetical protein
MDTNFKELYEMACKAGREAGERIKPRPMIVGDGTTSYFVPEGLCGFAWIHIVSAKEAFVKWLKEHDIGYKNYRKGWDVWVSDFGQSHARKVEFASAFAKVLNDHGIECYPEERLD